MKRILMLVAGVALVILGVKLARYADIDDAPGGMVIGWLIITGGVVVAVRGVLPVSSDQPRA